MKWSASNILHGRGGRDDMGAGPASQLDGKDPNVPCCTQDGFPRREARVIKKGLPGRQCRQRNGCGLHMVGGVRPGGKLAG